MTCSRAWTVWSAPTRLATGVGRCAIDSGSGQEESKGHRAEVRGYHRDRADCSRTGRTGCESDRCQDRDPNLHQEGLPVRRSRADVVHHPQGHQTARRKQPIWAGCPVHRGNELPHHAVRLRAVCGRPPRSCQTGHKAVRGSKRLLSPLSANRPTVAALDVADRPRRRDTGAGSGASDHVSRATRRHPSACSKATSRGPRRHASQGHAWRPDDL